MTWERRRDLSKTRRMVILEGKSTFMFQLLPEVRLTNLCDFVLWNCLKVGRGKCEATVSSCIVWEKFQWHIFFPMVPITEVNAVRTDKPVRAWNDPHNKRQLEIESRKWSIWKEMHRCKRKRTHELPPVAFYVMFRHKLGIVYFQTVSSEDKPSRTGYVLSLHQVRTAGLVDKTKCDSSLFLFFRFLCRETVCFTLLT